MNPWQGLAADAPVIRDDKVNQADNVIYNWEVGDKAGTDRAFEQADVISKLELPLPAQPPVADRVLRLGRRLQPGHPASSRST